MRLLSWLVVNTLAVGAAVWLFDGITLTGDTDGERVVTLIAIGAIFGAVTTFIRPIVNFVSIILIILTLGLMLLVTNALMLLLTSWIAGQADLGFHVDGFWTALGGSIVISICSLVLDFVLSDRR